MERGMLRIKPVFIGIPHYRDVYGSVCSADVEGTPPRPAPTDDELRRRAGALVEDFTETADFDFVEVEKPFIVKDHVDLRQLPEELTYDTDALLMGMYANTPLPRRALERLGLPMLRGPVGEPYLRAMRARKFLRQSKFLYIGEIPSFSAPLGPWDFGALEKRLGVRVRHIETNEFFRWFDRPASAEVHSELEKWRADFAEVAEPTEEDLLQATRVLLALRGLARLEDANGIAINCGRLTEERPVVPCLAFARLIDEGIMCACEGDVTAMLSSLILHGASRQSVLMGNFGARTGQFEARDGQVSIEHDVIPRSMATSGFTVRDYHGRRFGVTGYAPIRAGEPMTLLNIAPDLGKMSVLQGTVTDSEDGGHCRVIVHMTVEGEVQRVPDVIVGSQHVSMAFGHWLEALEETARIMGMEVRTL